MKTAKTPGARRDLWIVPGFVLLTFLPFAGKAYTVDETYFLSIARHILQDPLHPQSFLFNWFGRSELVFQINTVPTMVCYTRTIRIDSPIPLRLISGRGAQGGFYSSSYGYLPCPTTADSGSSPDITFRKAPP